MPPDGRAGRLFSGFGVPTERENDMKKTKAVIIGVFLLALLAAAFKMPEAADGKVRVKALNPEFVRNRLEAKAGRIVHFSRQGHPLGFIPSPVNLSNVRFPEGSNKFPDYPARYDLRTLNKLTPVKDQGSCGSCWAFATTASMESFLMPGEEKNFSEQNLNAHHGFDNAECEGGNSWMAAAYFTRWDGPILESDDPYPYYKAADLTVRKHIQQALLLPARKNYLDNDVVKYLLTYSGAVEASFAYDDDHYSYAHSSYYCPNDIECNHSVAIVGWDDDYPASNFRTTAPGNGAFVVKNSWGTSWGDDGFFYLSYYDKSLDTMSCFNNAEPVVNYQRIYQYDPLGWTTNVGIITDAGLTGKTRATSTTGWGANLFTARDNLSLRAVGFYTTDTIVKYEIRVYKNVQAGRPRSGTLAESQNGAILYSGFHTVALNTPVALGNGGKILRGHPLRQRHRSLSRPRRNADPGLFVERLGQRRGKFRQPRRHKLGGRIRVFGGNQRLHQGLCRRRFRGLDLTGKRPRHDGSGPGRLPHSAEQRVLRSRRPRSSRGVHRLDGRFDGNAESGHDHRGRPKNHQGGISRSFSVPPGPPERES